MENSEILQQLEEKFQEIGLEVLSIKVVDEYIYVFLPLSKTGMVLYLFYSGMHWIFKCGAPARDVSEYWIYNEHRMNWPDDVDVNETVGSIVGFYSRWDGVDKCVIRQGRVYEDEFFWYQLKRYAERLF